LKQWSDKSNEQAVISMSIENNMEMIEDEYRLKFLYEDLLADLLSFVYVKFLLSDVKYTRDGFITKSKNYESYSISDR
jgi:hypothetical protein